MGWNTHFIIDDGFSEVSQLLIERKDISVVRELVGGVAEPLGTKGEVLRGRNVRTSDGAR